MRATRKAVILAVTVAAAAGATSAFAALPPKARISHSGLGPIKLGMTEAQVERAAKRSIRVEYFPSSTCGTAALAGKTFGLFIGNRLRRIYIRTKVFATRKGIRVGNTEERLLAAYPDGLVRTPQKYTPEEDDLTLRKNNRKLIFSLKNGRISEISTGLQPEIDYVEGCA